MDNSIPPVQFARLLWGPPPFVIILLNAIPRRCHYFTHQQSL
jgi:hypothetical protein